jgi:hypothetical protein
MNSGKLSRLNAAKTAPETVENAGFPRMREYRLFHIFSTRRLIMKNIAALSGVSAFAALTVFLAFGMVFTGCDPEDNSSGNGNGGTNGIEKSIKLTGLGSDYSMVYFAGLINNSTDEYPAIGNPYASVAVTGGTATIGMYDLQNADFDPETGKITGALWKGTGSYFVFIGLVKGNTLEHHVSKNKVTITDAVTDIAFGGNFNLRKTDFFGN